MGSQQSSNGKRILVVEDHSDSAEMMKMVLEEEGYEVRWAETAGAALQILSPPADAPCPHWQPDLILLDLSLPDMDGVEMIGWLRAAGQTVPPVIVASARPVSSVEATARSINAGVLPKPFDIDELLTGIEAALSSPATPSRESGT